MPAYLAPRLLALAPRPLALVPRLIALAVMAASLSIVTGAEIATTDGRNLSGTIRSMTSLWVQLADGRELPLDTVSAIRFPDVELRDSPETTVSLVGGSQITAQAVEFDGSKLTLDLRRQPDFVVPARDVAAIRFRAAAPSTDNTWLGLLAQDSASDRMVIRRDGNRLDSIEGAVASIADGVVKFEIDGVSVDAPKAKLEGVLLRVSQSQGSSKPFTVTDAYGGRWRADAIAINESRLLTLQLGRTNHAMSLDQVRQILFGGSSVPLAQAERADTKMKSPFDLKLAPAMLEDFFLSTDSQSSDLELPAGTSIQFRVPDGMTRLIGSVVRPQEIRRGGSLAIAILDGEDVLWSASIDDAQRQGFDLAVDQSRRITIRVDDGGDGDLGDRIRFPGARFVR